MFLGKHFSRRQLNIPCSQSKHSIPLGGQRMCLAFEYLSIQSDILPKRGHGVTHG